MPVKISRIADSVIHASIDDQEQKIKLVGICAIPDVGMTIDYLEDMLSNWPYRIANDEVYITFIGSPEINLSDLLIRLHFALPCDP